MVATIAELVDALEQLRNDAAASRNRLVAIYLPGAPKLTTLSSEEAWDPRHLIARHLRATFGTTFLNAIFLQTQISHPTWWKSQFGVDFPEPSDFEAEVEYYQVMLQASFVYQSFSLFEAGVRRIVRAMDPTACKDVSDHFINVILWLLARLKRDRWGYAGGDPENFFRLFAYVRNTIHTNAAFHHREGNKTATWAGQTYQFENGKVPGFVQWDFSLMLARELVQLNEALMTAPVIRNLTIIPL